MSKKTQKAHVDRLNAALERKGISLKRHELIEIAAQSFGYADSNHLAAAAKRGELNPPVSRHLEDFSVRNPAKDSPIGVLRLRCLYDAEAQKAFALQLDDFDPTSKEPFVVISPYGNMMTLPEHFYGEPIGLGIPSWDVIEHNLAENEKASKRFDPSDFDNIRKEGRQFAVEIEWIGEGEDGDYDPTDPRDYPLIRFNAERRSDDGEWEHLDDGSYCTQIRLPSDPMRGDAIVEYLLDRIEQNAGSHPKRFLEQLSWTNDSDIDHFIARRAMTTKPLEDRYRNIHVPMKGTKELILSTREMTLIEGREHLTLASIAPYPDSIQCTNLMESLVSFQRRVSTKVDRLGALLSIKDYPRSRQIETSLHIPVHMVKDFASSATLEMGLIALFGEPNFAPATAKFHPEAWIRNEAVDVDPQGPVEFDVTFEVLRMGADARDLESNSADSDQLMQAIAAHDWIYDWSNAYRVSVEESVFELINETETEHAVLSVTSSFTDKIRKAYDAHGDAISAIAVLENGDDIGDELDDIASEIKSSLAAEAANMVHEDCAEDTIAAVEKWVTGNVSNCTWRNRIAAAIAFLGLPEAVTRLCSDSSDEDRVPTIGTAAIMPDGETTIIVDHVIIEMTNGWIVQDLNGDRHTISFDGSNWVVDVQPA